MSARKRVLFLVRRPPYAGAVPYEGLEAMLVAGVFEQDVTIVFLDDGVYQLLKGQDAVEIGRRNVGHGLRALETYDVKRLFVDTDSLRTRGLTDDDLEIAASHADADAVRSLIASHDVVVTA